MDTDFGNSLDHSTDSGVNMVPDLRFITNAGSYSGPLNTIHESTDSGYGNSINIVEQGSSHSLPMTQKQSLGQTRSDKMLPLKKRRLNLQADPVKLIPGTSASSEEFDKHFRSLPIDLSRNSQIRYTTPPLRHGSPILHGVVRTVSSNEPLYIPQPQQSSTQVTTNSTPATQTDMVYVVRNFAMLNTMSPQRPEQHAGYRQVTPMDVSPAASPASQHLDNKILNNNNNMDEVAEASLYRWNSSTNGKQSLQGTEFSRNTITRESGSLQHIPTRQEHTDAKPAEVRTNPVPNNIPEIRYRCRNATDSPPDVSQLSHTQIASDAADSEITPEYCRMVAEADDDGDLPLHIAVVQEEPFAVDKMIAIMKKINMPLDYCNRIKQTPLHLATITKQPLIIKKLLQAKSSPNIPDRKGHTCCHLSVNYNSPECLRAIFEHSSVRVDIDANNFEGLTALHRAVQQGHLECAQLLLQYGAQINLVDGKSGKTPLYLAFECNQPRAADLLISQGADVNIATYSGSTVMQAANSKGQHLLNNLIERNDGEITNSSVRELQSKLSAKANRNRQRSSHSLPLTTNSNKRQLPVSPVNATPLSTQNYKQDHRYETM